ncbi:MAG: DNA-directed RNA polymerase subunit L [Archaeoglobi archaeon]|nr:DNA-directed RNA polymerase subunit L [Candidatus Mnemosynella bozhongmuii]
MEVKIISKTDNELKMEIRGEDHTLLNLLRTNLLEYPSVEEVWYDISHPMVSHPVLYLRTKDEDPIELLKKVLNVIKEDLDELDRNFREALGIEE